MKIIQVVGARPNFMKVAPIHKALQAYPQVQDLLVHTGQHTEAAMSDVFFKQLGLKLPDFFLGVTADSPNAMVAKIMLEFEKILVEEKPDRVVVVGDVNSTLACALTAARCGVPVAHVEAGLRSWDRDMPEEINRILTDQISDDLFVTEAQAVKNLRNENIPEEKIHFVGNCMIDSLVSLLPIVDANPIASELKLRDEPFALMTMHRPSNVDTDAGLEKLLHLIRSVAASVKLLFPVHPRTKNRLEHFGKWKALNSIPNLVCTGPLGYVEFIRLLKSCELILTDSGGVQEESTFLNVPCLTFRKSTERPVTVEIGTNILLDDLDVDQTMQEVAKLLKGHRKPASVPELWDGRAAERIASILVKAS
ncbi:MAG TPA: UDP-N-acetylglucosamine 2-epimerase (non-hydrolyzing) [Saprospiraceae bacterium]|nr:UDP-N-acetylglucosamine 2-epimerase (non-hydrolyzing) [Saprospiraceae bacterium]